MCDFTIPVHHHSGGGYEGNSMWAWAGPKRNKEDIKMGRAENVLLFGEFSSRAARDGLSFGPSRQRLLIQVNNIMSVVMIIRSRPVT